MSNLAPHVSFILSSTKDFEDRSLARKIVEAIMSAEQAVRPETFGAFQPLKTRIVDSESVVDVFVNAKGPKEGVRGGSLLMERGSDVGYQIQWNKGFGSKFADVSGHISFSKLDEDVRRRDQWLQVIRHIVEVLEPAYGEVRSMAYEGWDTPLNLELRLPDIPPISIYGKPYIELFGEKILAAPFRSVSRVGESWLVASSEITEEVPAVDRREIRAHLGEEAFMADGRWKYRDGIAPRFVFRLS